MSFSFRALFMRLACPACKAPIVGTKPTLPLADALKLFSSSTLLIICIVLSFQYKILRLAIISKNIKGIN